MRRYLLTIGLAVGLVLATIGPISATRLSDFPWDVKFTYTMNSTRITGYSVSGPYDFAVDCHGTWSEVVNATSETTSSTHTIEYSWSYDRRELGFEEVENGSVSTKVWACGDSTLAEVTDDGEVWTVHHECSGDNRVLGKEIDNLVGQAPFDIDLHLEIDARSTWDGACYVTRGAKALAVDLAVVPFTGRLNPVPDEDAFRIEGLRNRMGGDNLIATVYNIDFVGGFQLGNAVDTFGDWQEENCDIEPCGWDARIDNSAVLGGPFGLPGTPVGSFGLQVDAGST